MKAVIEKKAIVFLNTFMEKVGECLHQTEYLIQHYEQPFAVTRIWEDEYHRNLTETENDVIDELYIVESV